MLPIIVRPLLFLLLFSLLESVSLKAFPMEETEEAPKEQEQHDRSSSSSGAVEAARGEASTATRGTHLVTAEEGPQEEFENNLSAQGMTVVASSSSSTSLLGKRHFETEEEPALLPTMEPTTIGRSSEITIPSLYQMALEKVVKLPPNHPSFASKKSIEKIEGELDAVWLVKMTDFISQLEYLEEKSALHSSSRTGARGSRKIAKLKQELERCSTVCTEAHEQKQYGYLLVVTNSMKVAFLEIEQEIAALRKMTEIEEQSQKIVGNNALISYLSTQESCWSATAQALHAVAIAKIKVAKQILKDSSSEEVSAQQSHDVVKAMKVANIWSMMAQEREEGAVFLERLGNSAPATSQTIVRHYQAALTATRKVARAIEEETEARFYEAITNTHLQIAKLVMSQHPEILKLQKPLIEINEQLLTFLTAITDDDQGVTEIQTKYQIAIETNPFYKVIADFYQYAIEDVERATALREQAMDAFLDRKQALSNATTHVADLFLHLAREEVRETHILLGLGMIPEAETFCNATRQATRLAEENLHQQAETLGVDRDAVSIPWNFRATFEENMTALEHAATTGEK